jgi:hypothetical protein
MLLGNGNKSNAACGGRYEGGRRRSLCSSILRRVLTYTVSVVPKQQKPDVQDAPLSYRPGPLWASSPRAEVPS